MKTRITLVLILVGAFTTVNAIGPPPHFKTRLGKYVSFNVGYTTSFFHVQQGTLFVSFPYQSTTADNVTTSYTFARYRTNPFPRTPKFFDVCFQMGSLRHFVQLHCAGNNMNEVLLTVGYGYRYQIPDHASFVKFSIDFGANLASRQMGTIDNEDLTIDVLGKTANPTFRYTHHSRYSYYTRTYHASDLDVKYFQTNWIFAPSIALECHPFQNKFHFELFTTYFISVANVATINMFQQMRNTYPTHTLHNFSLKKEGLTVQYNGETIRHSPFHFGGVAVGVRIGFSTFVKRDYKK